MGRAYSTQLRTLRKVVIGKREAK